jgi:CPA1 family monovalent cation:H+ antiporter
VDRARVASIPLFDGLPKGELDAVARCASEREFAPGEALTTEGDFGHALLVLDSGTAEVSVNGTRVREIGPGEMIGEVAVLASGRRTASVFATSPVRALVWFKRDVWQLDQRAPEAAGRVRAALDQRLTA